MFFWTPFYLDIKFLAPAVGIPVGWRSGGRRWYSVVGSEQVFLSLLGCYLNQYQLGSEGGTLSPSAMLYNMQNPKMSNKGLQND